MKPKTPGKTPEQVAEEKREESRLIDQIKKWTERVPASQNSWSYQQAVSFKKSVASALSEIKKVRKDINSLRAAVNSLAAFYN